jgi:hypothetical protein
MNEAFDTSIDFAFVGHALFTSASGKNRTCRNVLNGLLDDFDGAALRRLVRLSKSANQARRLLALTEIYDSASLSAGGADCRTPYGAWCVCNHG